MLFSCTAFWVNQTQTVFYVLLSKKVKLFAIVFCSKNAESAFLHMCTLPSVCWLRTSVVLISSWSVTSGRVESSCCSAQAHIQLRPNSGHNAPEKTRPQSHYSFSLRTQCIPVNSPLSAVVLFTSGRFRVALGCKIIFFLYHLLNFFFPKTLH